MAEAQRDEIAKLEALYAANPEGHVFTHLAEAYRKAGELEHARDILAEGLRRHPDSASAHVVLGRVEHDRADEEAARRAFTRVLSLDAGNLIALRELGELALERGDRAEALEHFRELLSRDVNDLALQQAVDELSQSLELETTIGVPPPPTVPTSFVEPAPPVQEEWYLEQLRIPEAYPETRDEETSPGVAAEPVPAEAALPPEPSLAPESFDLPAYEEVVEPAGDLEPWDTGEPEFLSLEFPAVETDEVEFLSLDTEADSPEGGELEFMSLDDEAPAEDAGEFLILEPEAETGSFEPEFPSGWLAADGAAGAEQEPGRPEQLPVESFAGPEAPPVEAAAESPGELAEPAPALAAGGEGAPEWRAPEPSPASLQTELVPEPVLSPELQEPSWSEPSGYAPEPESPETAFITPEPKSPEGAFIVPEPEPEAATMAPEPELLVTEPVVPASEPAMEVPVGEAAEGAPHAEPEPVPPAGALEPGGAIAAEATTDEELEAPAAPELAAEAVAPAEEAEAAPPETTAEAGPTVPSDIEAEALEQPAEAEALEQPAAEAETLEQPAAEAEAPEQPAAEAEPPEQMDAVVEPSEQPAAEAEAPEQMAAVGEPEQPAAEAEAPEQMAAEAAEPALLQAAEAAEEPLQPAAEAELVLAAAFEPPIEPIPIIDELMPLGDLSPARASPGPEPGVAPEAAAGLFTETMAELYRSQGFADRAAEVYRWLLARDPEDARLQALLAEVTEQAPGAAPAPAPSPREWLRDVLSVESAFTGGAGTAAGGDSPYAWSGTAEEPALAGPTIGAYFRELLAWRPSPLTASPGAELLLDEVIADEPSPAGEDVLMKEPSPQDLMPWDFAEPVALAESGEAEDGFAAAEPGMSAEAAAPVSAEAVAPIPAEPAAPLPAETGAGTGPEASTPAGEVEAEDEDLEMFRSWLQSLKK